MPKHPFFILEQLYRLDGARAELVEKGRQMVEHDQKLLAYIRQQCQAADDALQGKYSMKAILLMDRAGIRTMNDLWKYRQFMAAIYGYRGVRDIHWVQTNTQDNAQNEELLHELQPEPDPRNRIAGVIIASQEPLPSPLELKTMLGL
jgi:hypothetical protein